MASSQSVDEIRTIIEADSLGYLSPEGLLTAAQSSETDSYCDACFTSDYPVQATAPAARRQLRLIEV